MGVRLLDKLTMLYKELEYYSKCNLKDEMAKRLETYSTELLNALTEKNKDIIMNVNSKKALKEVVENGSD